MIQDDPINNLKSKAQGYFPQNLDSEEEIVLKDIEIAKEVKVKEVNGANRNVYYKYLMLIGLCKNLGRKLGLLICVFFRHSTGNSTWPSIRVDSLHVKE